MDTRSLEYNVVCVKWGDKFTPEHVNRLYRMAKKNISLPFNFYCYTENSNGLNQEIKIAPLDESLDLKAWWWKLTLFKRNDRPEGINLYLDLDVVIQNNIDEIFKRVVKDKLTILESFDLNMNFTEFHFDVNTLPFYNSSIMVWYNNENINLYEKFITNTELYMKVYHGIDRFFSYEIDQYFFNSLSDEYYYFRSSHDYDDSDFLFTDLIMVRDWGSYTKRIYYHPERSICVFNGCHQDYFYTGMEKYFF
jgi:hypothetical protein